MSQIFIHSVQLLSRVGTYLEIRKKEVAKWSRHWHVDFPQVSSYCFTVLVVLHSVACMWTWEAQLWSAAELRSGPGALPACASATELDSALFSNTRFSVLVFEYSFWEPCSNLFEYSNNRFSTGVYYSQWCKWTKLTEDYGFAKRMKHLNLLGPFFLFFSESCKLSLSVKTVFVQDVLARLDKLCFAPDQLPANYQNSAVLHQQCLLTLGSIVSNSMSESHLTDKTIQLLGKLHQTLEKHNKLKLGERNDIYLCWYSSKFRVWYKSLCTCRSQCMTRATVYQGRKGCICTAAWFIQVTVQSRLYTICICVSLLARGPICVTSANIPKLGLVFGQGKCCLSLFSDNCSFFLISDDGQAVPHLVLVHAVGNAANRASHPLLLDTVRNEQLSPEVQTAAIQAIGPQLTDQVNMCPLSRQLSQSIMENQILWWSLKFKDIVFKELCVFKFCSSKPASFPEVQGLNQVFLSIALFLGHECVGVGEEVWYTSPSCATGSVLCIATNERLPSWQGWDWVQVSANIRWRKLVTVSSSCWSNLKQRFLKRPLILAGCLVDHCQQFCRQYYISDHQNNRHKPQNHNTYMLSFHSTGIWVFFKEWRMHEPVNVCIYTSASPEINPLGGCTSKLQEKCHHW